MKDRSFKYAKIVRLIHLYRVNRCLWDVSSPDFRRQQKRQAILLKIGKLFDRTPSEIKRKIRSLRATYLMERRKVLASEKNVQDGLEKIVYDPILAWYKYMSFLNDVIVFRTPKKLELQNAADTSNVNGTLEDSDLPMKETEEGEQSHLVKVEEVYCDNDDCSFKVEEIPMHTEYLEAKYICDETNGDTASIDSRDDTTDYLVEDEEQSADNDQDGENTIKVNNDELFALKAEKIKAETEYFRKKAKYIDICIEKEKKLQPLLLTKLKLEIENLRKSTSKTNNCNK